MNFVCGACVPMCKLSTPLVAHNHTCIYYIRTHGNIFGVKARVQRTLTINLHMLQYSTIRTISAYLYNLFRNDFYCVQLSVLKDVDPNDDGQRIRHSNVCKTIFYDSITRLLFFARY